MKSIDYIPNIPLVDTKIPSLKNRRELLFFIVRKYLMLVAKLCVKLRLLWAQNAILSLNEMVVTDLYLKDKLSEVLHKEYVSKEKKVNKTIWTFWLQGVENAPPLVQQAIKNQKRFATKYGYKHIILNKDNVFDYIDIPDFILNRYTEMRLSIAQLADYVRFKLLRDYGGVWVDATIFLNENFSEDMLTLDNYHAKDTLYLRYITGIRARYEYCWTHYPNHFLIAQKNSILYQYMVDAFELYVQKFENRFDYFFTIYLQHLGVKYNQSVQTVENKIPSNNQAIDLLALYPIFVSKDLNTSNALFNFPHQNAYKTELSRGDVYQDIRGDLFKILVQDQFS